VSESGFMDDPNLAILVAVAQALGDLCESLVFVGGCATGLLLTAQRAQSIRATQVGLKLSAIRDGLIKN